MLKPLAILLTTIQILPTSATINCRTACMQCRQRTESLDLLEVYCSMCDECMERRREWRGSDQNRREFNENINAADNCYPQDDCIDVPLGYSSTTTTTTSTTTTTTSTSTTTTTIRPCIPKPPCIARPPCLTMPCMPAMPFPMCGMCPMTAPSTVPSTTQGIKLTETDNSNGKYLYLYLGVPNKVLNELKLG